MPTKERPLDRLMNLTMEVHRILRHQNIRALRGMGVSVLQLHGLLLVRERPGISMKELAEHLSVTSPTATVFVARLEDQGMLRRIHDRENRKIVRVHLTPEGGRIAEKAFRAFQRSFRSLFRLLPSSDQDVLAHSFDRLIRLYRMTHHG